MGLRRPHLPWPALAALAVLIASGVAGMVVAGGNATAGSPRSASLAEVARAARCRVTDFDRLVRTNPSTGGRVVDERITARDGSYVASRPPSALGSLHALMHGRVLIQYRPDLPASEVAALDRLVAADPRGVLLFANRSGMPTPLAAAAYLTLMTCPRADGPALKALQAMRDRRAGFRQGW